MNTNYFKHSEILIGLIAILTGLMLVGCQIINPIQTDGSNTADTMPPIITVAGFTNGQITNVKDGDGFVIPQATATDDIDGTVAVRINDGGYDNNEIGVYNIAYLASDNEGNSSVFTLTIIVVSRNTTSPVIIVRGYSNTQSINVVAGDGFVIPEAIAIDDIDGPVAVATNDGGYDNNEIGVYNVAYSASDNKGNSSVFTLTIIVEPNRTPPVITVAGFTNGQTTNVVAGDGFVIPEAIAIDDIDGPVAVATNDGGYDNNLTNTYEVEYSAEDTAGNSNVFTLTIIVELDTTPPVITVAGFTDGQTNNVEVGDGFVIPEATATDNIDSTVVVMTNEDGYDNNIPRTYITKYTAKDSAGNGSTFTLTIIVKDTTPPTITVTGYTNGQTVNIESGEGFAIPEATATDNASNVAVITNRDNYDNDVTKTYTVVYTATDNAGNATTFTLIIIVVDNYDANGFYRETGIHRDTAKILASDGERSDSFGISVDIDSDYAIVGASSDDDRGNTSGAAYIFNRNGSNNWIQQAKLIANDTDANDNFGLSVSIDGDYAVVGAYLNNNSNGVSSGAAYIFNRSGNSWTQQAKLTASDEIAVNFFGYSVSIDGDYTIVGAYLNSNHNGNQSGAAYIFNRSGSNWTQQIKLTASDGNRLDNFGYSVSIDGDYSIVSAPSADNIDTQSGSVYIFNRDGTNWNQQAKLIASDGASFDSFGQSVNIDGDYVIVGEYPNRNAVGDINGSAYIFNRSGDNWTQQAKLTASDVSINDYFGSSVSIDGDYAVVGAYLNNNSDGITSGSAYIFNRTGTSWTEQVKLNASDGTMFDSFGLSVAIDSNYILIGAGLGGESTNADTGSAYIYELRR